MLAAPTLVLLAEGAEKDIDELMAGIARSWSSTWCSGDHFTMLAQLVRGHEKWMTEAREVRAAGGCLAPLLGASKRSELFGLILALQSGFVAIWGSERHHPAMSEGLGARIESWTCVDRSSSGGRGRVGRTPGLRRFRSE